MHSTCGIISVFADVTESLADFSPGLERPGYTHSAATRRKKKLTRGCDAAKETSCPSFNYRLEANITMRIIHRRALLFLIVASLLSQAAMQQAFSQRSSETA